jgi:hypothetical protein
MIFKLKFLSLFYALLTLVRTNLIQWGHQTIEHGFLLPRATLDTLVRTSLAEALLANILLHGGTLLRAGEKTR